MAAPQTQPSLTLAAPDGGTAEDMRDRIAELTEAVAARDTFIAVAAHELRNPMTPIIGHIDLLLLKIRAGRCPPEQVEQQLEHIQHSVHRYLKRAAILLDVSRLTSGSFQLEPEPFDLALMLREVINEFSNAAQRMGVPIRLTTPTSLPGTWDRLAVEQVVDNLVSNALKYGGRTPVEYGGRTPVEVSADLGDEHVRIRVHDHGEGISPDDRARVFQRFERAVGQGERRSGFGVGLWVVGQLVDAMKGTIAIADAPGGGALFTVTLPQRAGGERS